MKHNTKPPTPEESHNCNQETQHKTNRLRRSHTIVTMKNNTKPPTPEESHNCKPNSYIKLYIHIVLVVWGRLKLISASSEEKIYSYIAGTIQKKGHKPILINGMPDHLHILVGMKPSESISDLVREIKKSSNAFINDNRLSRGKFCWQEGFGAFSFSRHDMDSIYNYVLTQKDHHNMNAFKEEYLDLLKKHDISYDEKYLFLFDN